MSLNLAKISFSLPAGQGQEYPLTADFYRLDLFPSGLLLGVNGGQPNSYPEGFQQKGAPGAGEIRLLRLVNPTGSTLVGAFSHGTGDIDLPGVTVLSGSLPLPTGASTSANQAAANTALGAMQTSLATLVAPVVRYCRVTPVNAGGDVVIESARALDILNTHTSLNLTITVAGQPAFTLGPGQGLSWPLIHPRESAYPTVTIAAPASGTGTLAFVI